MRQTRSSSATSDPSGVRPRAIVAYTLVAGVLVQVGRVLLDLGIAAAVLVALVVVWAAQRFIAYLKKRIAMSPVAAVAAEEKTLGGGLLTSCLIGALLFVFWQWNTGHRIRTGFSLDEELYYYSHLCWRQRSASEECRILRERKIAALAFEPFSLDPGLMVSPALGRVPQLSEPSELPTRLYGSPDTPSEATALQSDDRDVRPIEVEDLVPPVLALADTGGLTLASPDNADAGKLPDPDTQLELAELSRIGDGRDTLKSELPSIAIGSPQTSPTHAANGMPTIGMSNGTGGDSPPTHDQHSGFTWLEPLADDRQSDTNEGAGIAVSSRDPSELGIAGTSFVEQEYLPIPTERGDPEVRRYQTELAWLGLNPGPIDGIPGRRTARAHLQYLQTLYTSGARSIDPTLVDSMHERLSRFFDAELAHGSTRYSGETTTFRSDSVQVTRNSGMSDGWSDDAWFGTGWSDDAWSRTGWSDNGWFGDGDCITCSTPRNGSTGVYVDNSPGSYLKASPNDYGVMNSLDHTGTSSNLAGEIINMTNGIIQDSYSTQGNSFVSDMLPSGNMLDRGNMLPSAGNFGGGNYTGIGFD